MDRQEIQILTMMRKEQWKEKDTEFGITKTMTSGNKSISQPLGKSQ